MSDQKLALELEKCRHIKFGQTMTKSVFQISSIFLAVRLVFIIFHLITMKKVPNYRQYLDIQAIV